MLMRAKEAKQGQERSENVLQGISKLADIWHDTVAKNYDNSIQAAPYCEFVATFNKGFVNSLAPNLGFETMYSTEIDLLATNGIESWPTFINKFFETGLLSPEEPILRYKSADGKQHLLMIEDLANELVRMRNTGETFYLSDLVESSQASVASGDGPTLIPIAAMRYWAMFAIGNGVILEDGMPYEKLSKLNLAMSKSQLSSQPRSLTIYPYTNLNKFTPKDITRPYADLSEDSNAVEYLF